MKKDNLITVIMLTYNREALVSRAIECVLSQTFHDFEFIIVDNGSTDRSGIIADEYERNDERIRVIHRVRGNIGSGRNVGLNAANGKNIAFVDDDDWFEPDYLEFLYNLAAEYDADVSICGATDKAFDEKCIMNAEESLLRLFWRKHYNVQFPTKLIRRELFSNNRFSESAKYDDIELMPRILADAGRIAYHGLPKYTFYRHENNNSKWTTYHNLLTSETLNEYLKAYRERTETLSVRFPKSAAAWKYFEWSFMISMVEKINRLSIGCCENQLETITNELLVSRSIFLESIYIQEFEKEWMEQYIK